MQIEHDGYTLRIVHSMYMDFGLEISRDGDSLFYSPHCLSSESWGMHWDDESQEPGEPWSQDDWRQELRYQADDLLECFLPLTELPS